MTQLLRSPGARKAVTSTDVARAAGVSQSAVSRAFTPGASISEETRTLVVETARKLGYRPNAIARTLIMGRSRLIGVAMSRFDNQFYPQLLEELSRALQSAGFHIILFTTEPGEAADPALEEILRYRTDALILAATGLSSSLADQCRAAGVPVVQINRTTHSENVSSVTGDNEVGGATIASFLAAGGHTRFAYMAGPDYASTNRERESGFTKRLVKLGCDTPQRVVGDYSLEGAQKAMRVLMDSKTRPDAVFCANDHMAIAALDVARHEYGLRPGTDISIVGFDNAGPAAWPSYALTTYEQSPHDMAEEAVRIIGEMMEDASVGVSRVRVPGTLIVRSSARVPQGVVEDHGRKIWNSSAK